MAKPSRRLTVPALLVAALYVVLAVSAPLIVRYGPQPEVATVSAYAR